MPRLVHMNPDNQDIDGVPIGAFMCVDHHAPDNVNSKKTGVLAAINQE